MSPIPCPDVRNLQALLDEGGEGGELVHHLETCADCQHTLEVLTAEPAVWEDAAEGLVDQSRQETALQELVARLKGEDPQPAEDLCFLQPSDRPGLLGLLGQYEVLEEIGRGGMGV